MYCTVDNVLNMTGGQNTDFSYLGMEMDLGQFRDLIKDFIEYATEQINQYCNVDTFEMRTIEDEYHTVSTNDRPLPVFGYPVPLVYPTMEGYYDYTNKDRTVFPREYPVQEILSVSTSYTLPNAPPVWKELKPRTETEFGDYSVVQRFNHTEIFLYRYIPNGGVNNLKMTYTAGYPEGHRIWSLLRMACVMIVINVLNYKKSSQEAFTVRGSGIQDYSSMFSNETGGMFLSRDVCAILDRFRRPYATPGAYR